MELNVLLSFQFTEAIYKTRLSSIESQPKKVVVVVFVDVIIVGHKNLTLKFGQNWVDYK